LLIQTRADGEKKGDVKEKNRTEIRRTRERRDEEEEEEEMYFYHLLNG